MVINEIGFVGKFFVMVPLKDNKIKNSLRKQLAAEKKNSNERELKEMKEG